MMMRSEVLFISPRSQDAALISDLVSELALSVDHAGDLEQARSKLSSDVYDVVLTEAALPDGDWTDVMHLAGRIAPDARVIVTAPHADARFWSEAINVGVYDLVAQPFAASEVQRILSSACGRDSNAAGRERVLHAAR